ncbi:MAG: TonB-dependent hemoglobin/transferrin/lactoferrin family receptor [Alphaproteobacteria bacterium]|jgi:hemoglobin/transferrin/lactoferrin receptor protein|nr:TonB-dependent hemoglobin/transferrin/lactoferrin family receptor [Alphaproteobacteria bacterium]
MSSKSACRGVIRCPALLVSFAALSAGLAGAEEDNGAEKERREDPVTVYATTNPIPVFDYPGQVSVISRDDIETFAPSAPSDMLRDVPGVDFAGGPRRTGEAPSIRGLSGENILILLDGARQSFISAHDGRFFLDPELVGTAEVVRGPASALYGSGAVGGVLAFETVDAEDLLRDGESWGARVRGGYQSVNEESFATLTGFGRQGGLDALASFGLRHSGDITLGSGAELPSDDEIGTGLIKLGYEISDALSAELSWQRFANSAVEPNNGQGTLGTGDDLLDRDVEKDIETETWRAGLNFDPASDLIESQLTVYRSDSGVDELDPTTSRLTVREIETRGLSLRNAARFDLAGASMTLTLGGDWYEDEQTGTDSTSTDGERAGVPDGRSEFMGVFVQLEGELDRPLGLPGRLILIPAARYDEFESEASLDADASRDDEISPRFAASYAPRDWLRIFGSYSEGFRAPSINELYLDGVHFPVPHPTLFDPQAGEFVFVNNNFVPNPNLEPETSATVEFGFGLDFDDLLTDGDRFQGKLSYYESEVEDLIDLRVNFGFDPTCFAPPAFFPCSAGTTDSANVDNAELEGVEAEFAYDAERFYARANFGSIEGTNTATGADVGALTPDRWAFDLGIRLPERDARLGARIQLAGDFERRGLDENGALTVVESRDGYSVLDLYASWQPGMAEGLRLDLGVDNVFEEDYERVFEGVSEPGRNFRIAASWQFGG